MEKETLVIEKNLSFLSKIQSEEIFQIRPALVKTLSIIASHPEGITVKNIALEQKLCPTSVYNKIYVLKEISEKTHPEIREKLNRILSSVIKEHRIGRRKKSTPRSMEDLKEFYPEENKILIFLLSHKEKWIIKDASDFFNISAEQVRYRLLNLKIFVKKTDCQELKEKINTAFSRFQANYGRRTPKTVNSEEELKKFFPKTAEVIFMINSSSVRKNIKEWANYRQVHKDTILYHLRAAKRVSENSENEFFKEYVDQAFQRIIKRKRKNKKQSNLEKQKKPRISKISNGKRGKFLEPIAGKTKDMFCPDCKGLLVLGKCVKCGKIWKQTKKRIIISKAKG